MGDEAPGGGAAHTRYRAEALERLESPEGLDDVAAVTDAKAWVAILAIGAAIAVLAAWGVLGRVPQVVTVPGMLVRDGAESLVRATAAGTVRELKVAVGDQVDAGDVLLTLDSGDGDVEEVRAPTSGSVQEVSVRQGTPVDSGVVVGKLLQTTSQAPLSAVAYVDAATASQFAGATDVTVQPTTVDPTKYGSLEGTVSFVSTLPASMDSMATMLQSAALAASFSEAAGGVAYLVMIEFEDPPQWTNNDPPFLLVDSTLADVSGVVSRKRPIALLFGS